MSEKRGVRCCLFREEFLADKIEVVLADNMTVSAVDAIVKAAKTGKIGDGKVFVSSIDNAIRIRTEETGEQAV